MKLPITPPSFPALFQETLGAPPDPEDFARLLTAAGDPAPGGKYRHWDILRHLEPPHGLSHKEWWLAIKLSRMASRKAIPLRDVGGQPFRYMLPDVAHEMLHDIDRRASGTIAMPDHITSPHTRDTYLVRSLIEEAITSSQLEGAATTRKVAKEMLQSGRPPRDRNERMIVNNYEAMRQIRDLKEQPITSKAIVRLQARLTADTLSDPTASGRLRRTSDEIVVEDASGRVLHTPPAAEELKERMKAFCAFANGKRPAGFTHPVVKAILLHFWMAYDHPFVDGNGRTARALFYWSMARDGYWLCEFLSISRILKAAPSKYARAFLYTETDDNDATYFILNQLGVITRAMDDLYKYLERKAQDLTTTRRLFAGSGPLRSLLNHRQLSLIDHALRHPESTYTIRSHRHSHGVSYQTARTDLLKLVELGLLEQSKAGHAFVFDAPRDLQERLATVDGRSAR